jgi:hypothetical protein
MAWYEIEECKKLSGGRCGITLIDEDGMPFNPSMGTLLSSSIESFLVQRHRPEDGKYIAVKSTHGK